MNGSHNEFIKYSGLQVNDQESLERSKEFYEFMNRRRSVRTFSSRPVAKEVIENIVMTASSAPSGANKQPWNFCVIGDPMIKKQVRKFAEEEEYKNYHGRMSETWMDDLKVFKTNWIKPHLEEAPYLIAVFKKVYNEDKSTNYYVNESVGIATGLLIAAIHNAGLITLTHTPSPMNFLNKVLNRPRNEKAFLLMPVGYAPEDAMVPNIRRKTLEEVVTWY